MSARSVLGGVATLLAGLSCALGAVVLGLTILFGSWSGPESFADHRWQVAVWYAIAFAGLGLSAVALRQGIRLLRGTGRSGWYLLAILGAAASYRGWYAFADYL